LLEGYQTFVTGVMLAAQPAETDFDLLLIDLYVVCAWRVYCELDVLAFTLRNRFLTSVTKKGLH